MYPSSTTSASAGTSRSEVTALASRTGSRRRNPANRNSSIVGGSGAVAAQRDRHRHSLTALGHLAPVRRSHLVALPMHRQLVLADHLDAVHPDVADAALRIARDHTGEGDVWSAVLRPADRHRELRQVH